MDPKVLEEAAAKVAALTTKALHACNTFAELLATRKESVDGPYGEYVWVNNAELDTAAKAVDELYTFITGGHLYELIPPASGGTEPRGTGGVPQGRS